MKILLLANSSDGLFSFRSDLIMRLLSLGNQITASTPLTGKSEELSNLGVSIIETDIDRRGMNPLRDFRLFTDYLKMMRREKPDLVITYTIKPNIYGGMVCRMLGIPYCVNITGLGTAFEKENLLKKAVVLLYKLSCKKAKTVFFENEENRQIFIRNRIAKEEQTYRLNGAGVNLRKFNVMDYPAGDVTHFLFIGRVMKEKGIYELITAMQMLQNDGIKADLSILGGFEEDCKDIIDNGEKDGFLHYYGFQTDIIPFVRASHCSVLPSWHEGMANVNLECAASGRPIITSDIYGCKEAVLPGVTGFLCEKKNAESLYCVMKKFCGISYEQRREMGLKGRKHMEDVFDKQKVVDETVNRIFEGTVC